MQEISSRIGKGDYDLAIADTKRGSLPGQAVADKIQNTQEIGNKDAKPPVCRMVYADLVHICQAKPDAPILFQGKKIEFQDAILPVRILKFSQNDGDPGKDRGKF